MTLRSTLGRLLLIAGLTIIWLSQSYGAGQPTDISWGVSFSKPQAEYLGVDWQENYLALLTDMEVRKLRLMSYWNRIEPSNDKYDFTDLDWQINQAAEHGASVSLAIGYRQPRWPECHLPAWVDASDEAFESNLVDYLETVANRYADHPALDSWQLENEISNRHFGDCDGLEFDKSRLEREIAVLKNTTPDTPVYNSTGNQSGVPLRQSANDGFAFSIYDNAYFGAFGRDWKWDFWYLPPLWQSARARAIELIHDKPVFVHELQFEPWGPTDLANLSRTEQNDSMSPQIMREIVNYTEKTGFDTVYLWGSEWWYQQKQQGNNQPWDVASSVFER